MKKIYEEPSVQVLELMSADTLLASGDVDIDVGDDGWLMQGFMLKNASSANSSRFGVK